MAQCISPFNFLICVFVCVTLKLSFLGPRSTVHPQVVLTAANKADSFFSAWFHRMLQSILKCLCKCALKGYGMSATSWTLFCVVRWLCGACPCVRVWVWLLKDLCLESCCEAWADSAVPTCTEPTHMVKGKHDLLSFQHLVTLCLAS